MKLRIILFFAVIFAISTTYFIFDFSEESYLENRTLKNKIEFEDGVINSVLTGDFQAQLEELLSDQILFRDGQVKLDAKVSAVFGIQNRFYEDFYQLNDTALVPLTDLMNTGFKQEYYTEEYYQNTELITSELEKLGVDYYVYYAHLGQYYCSLTYPDTCNQLSSEKQNDNFYFANDILNNDPNAFLAGDHHLTLESQYIMFQKVMENWGLSSQVMPLEYYYDLEDSIQTIGSQENNAKNHFGLKGTEYKPQFDPNMTLYQNGKEFDVDSTYQWNTNQKMSNRNYLTAGYCSQSSERVDTSEGQFYVSNPNAPVKENVLIIGDSQLCGVSAYFYKTFEQTHTFDYCFQKIDVLQYVAENDIDHVIYYGTRALDTIDTWFDFAEIRRRNNQ